jgi:hypothetical protein
MSRHSLRFRILLIDDDYEMNTRLEKILSGCRISIDKVDVTPEVDRLDVDLEERDDKPGFWRISESTLKRIRVLSNTPSYDLVITDFGLVPPQVQKALWGDGTGRDPTKEEIKSKILTVRDLRFQFEAWSELEKTHAKRKNVFTAARRVLLISFASRKGFEAFGPVVPNRSHETQGAFPTARILPLDSRQEFFGNDEFYDIYESARGRDLYRYLLGTYSIRIVELEMIKHVMSQSKKIRVRRSVFNIALFAGAIAVIGGVTQYLSNLALQLLSQGKTIGWWLLALGLVSLVLGALSLALTFEWFARTVVRWIGPEEEFNSE